MNVDIGEQHLRSKVPFPPQNITVIVGAHKTWRHPEFVKASYNQKEGRVVREIVFDKTKIHTVREVVPHEKYATRAAGSTLYDIGILVLNKAVHYSDTVGPICLPAPISTGGGFSTYVDQMATASGWGWQSNPGDKNPYGPGGHAGELQKVDMKVWSNARCSETISKLCGTWKDSACAGSGNVTIDDR